MFKKFIVNKLIAFLDSIGEDRIPKEISCQKGNSFFDSDISVVTVPENICQPDDVLYKYDNCEYDDFNIIESKARQDSNNNQLSNWGNSQKKLFEKKTFFCSTVSLSSNESDISSITIPSSIRVGKQSRTR